MPGREPTLGEVADDIAEIRQQQHAILARLDALPYVRVDLYEANHNALRSQIALELAQLRAADDREAQSREREIIRVDSRVNVLEARWTWLFRASVTGIVFPLIVGVMTLLLVSGR